MNVPHEKQFHFRDGSSADSLESLQQKIQGLSYQEFYHHVNVDKNDFANWIRYVLHEEQLANDLQKVTSIVETLEIVNDYLHPPQRLSPRQDAQTHIEEEIFGTSLPEVQEVPTTAPMAAPQIADFGAISAELEPEFVHDEPIHEEPMHEAQEPVKHVLQPEFSPQDQARMIVKDFMYGVVFGLIVGLILGKMI